MNNLMNLLKYEEYPFPEYYKNILTKKEVTPKNIIELKDINKKIKEIKMNLSDFDLNKEIINYLTLVNIGLNVDYKIDKYFYKALDSVTIFLENNDIDIIGYKYDEIIDPSFLGLMTYKKPIIKNNKLYLMKEKIFIGKTYYGEKRPKIDILDTMAHEFRHAMTSVDNNLFKKDNLIYRRCGLSETMYNMETDLNYEILNLQDEVFNSYFTEKVVNNILSLKYMNIKDKDIEKLLREITLNNKAGIYFSDSYTISRFLMEPLLVDKELLDIANTSAYNGNIADYFEYMKTIGIEPVTYDYDLEDISDSLINYIDGNSMLDLEQLHKFKQKTLKR